jgi:multisite-specific tRNA:(cytosine-C5)-methyltransferase
VRTDYDEVIKKNEKFERYYNELGIVEDEEKERFWEAVRRDLPNSFRFCGSKGHDAPVSHASADADIVLIVTLLLCNIFYEIDIYPRLQK